MSIKKLEEDQKQFKSDLNEITRGNTKKKISISNKNNRKYRKSL